MTAPSGFVIRPAEPADVGALAEVRVASWRSAYADLMPAALLAAMSAERSVEVFGRIVSAPAAEGLLWVAATSDGSVVGYALGGPARDPQGPAAWELAMIYLLSSVQGSGVADELMLRAVGDRAAYLWVLQGNDRAIRFYRRLGFVDDGGRTTHAASGLTEIRLVRPGPT